MPAKQIAAVDVFDFEYWFTLAMESSKQGNDEAFRQVFLQLRNKSAHDQEMQKAFESRILACADLIAVIVSDLADENEAVQLQMKAVRLAASFPLGNSGEFDRAAFVRALANE